MSVRVVYQGEPGAYSEAATYQLLGSGVKADGLENFEACFVAVQSGEAEFAMVPIENSLGGSIHANYDLQLRHELHIVAELDFRVRHCLMALPGVRRDDVKTVLSHPQALAQCDGYLRKWGLRGEPSYDTAGSAKLIASEDRRDAAAIASALAAEHYGLEVLESGIEDDSNNFTRFLLLAPRCLALTPERGVAGASSPSMMKTSVVFSLSNAPGVLFKALAAFSLRDIDLTKIESRPDKLGIVGRYFFPLEDEAASAQSAPRGNAGRFRYMFHVDCCSSLGEERMVCALRHLAEIAPFVRVLGCYPRGGKLTGFLRERIEQTAGFVPAAAALPPSPTTSPQAVVMSARPPTSRRRLSIGIVGFGNFGQFLARAFVRQGHEVRATSRSDYSVVASMIGVRFYASAEEMLLGCAGEESLPRLDVASCMCREKHRW